MGKRKPLTALEGIERQLGALDRGELEDLAATVARLLAIADQDDPEDDQAPGSAQAATGGAGWVDLKMINGYGPYAYMRWREGGTMKSKYLGRVAAVETSE